MLYSLAFERGEPAIGAPGNTVQWQFVSNRHPGSAAPTPAKLLCLNCPGHSAGIEVQAGLRKGVSNCRSVRSAVSLRFFTLPDAAGIDVGASEPFVAVVADRGPQPVRDRTLY